MSKISNEQQAAYYQYSKANGVGPEEAAKACNYAKASKQSPKDVTPKSQMTCSSNSSTSSCSSSSSTSSSSSSSSSSSTSSCSNSSSIFKTNTYNKNVNPNDIVRTGNPEQDAKNFAKKMGISYSKAQEILQNLFGSPQQKAESTTNDTDTATTTGNNNNNNMLALILNLLQNLMSAQQ